MHAGKFKCYISKSKLVLSECNDLYFIAIAFIAFTLHEIKQCPVFWGHPVVFVHVVQLINKHSQQIVSWFRIVSSGCKVNKLYMWMNWGDNGHGIIQLVTSIVHTTPYLPYLISRYPFLTVVVSVLRW